MKTLRIAAVAAAAITAAGMSHAATVDFSEFNEGDVLGAGTVLGGGVVADISAVGGVAQAVVFDTASGTTSTGNDPDLTSDFTNIEDAGDVRDFGNALIVQENATGGPDDLASGGVLTFSFLSDIFLDELFLLDSAAGTVATLLADGNIVASFTLTDDNDSDTGQSATNNKFTLLDFGGATGDTLVVDFEDSGAIGQIEISAVPVPAGLPLLLGGMGAFAWMKRRKKA
ncbi:VPLPA-CTERM sorting domain-containing protein [uncultured Roseobacter sp.]|uniref:VPLPA-CTERM sorting domain-containing protein n=1 Tax=uncultured Roseobacter sp. TaxID=114847 RepID=UPI0026051C3B|nr:VPLPA-CTERM sorting domain-containing protein [uncultured Roseobacter sp.]